MSFYIGWISTISRQSDKFIFLIILNQNPITFVSYTNFIYQPPQSSEYLLYNCKARNSLDYQILLLMPEVKSMFRNFNYYKLFLNYTNCSEQLLVSLQSSEQLIHCQLGSSLYPVNRNPNNPHPRVTENNFILRKWQFHILVEFRAATLWAGGNPHNAFGLPYAWVETHSIPYDRDNPRLSNFNLIRNPNQHNALSMSSI